MDSKKDVMMKKEIENFVKTIDIKVKNIPIGQTETGVDYCDRCDIDSREILDICDICLDTKCCGTAKFNLQNKYNLLDGEIVNNYVDDDFEKLKNDKIELWELTKNALIRYEIDGKYKNLAYENWTKNNSIDEEEKWSKWCKIDRVRTNKICDECREKISEKLDEKFKNDLKKRKYFEDKYWHKYNNKIKEKRAYLRSINDNKWELKQKERDSEKARINYFIKNNEKVAKTIGKLMEENKQLKFENNELKKIINMMKNKNNEREK